MKTEEILIKIRNWLARKVKENLIWIGITFAMIFLYYIWELFHNFYK